MKARRVINPENGKVTATHDVVLRTACGKYGYTTRKAAAHAAASQRRIAGENVHAYHCTRGCHLFHIGHPPGQPRRLP